jgi:hypothetical protein
VVGVHCWVRWWISAYRVKEKADRGKRETQISRESPANDPVKIRAKVMQSNRVEAGRQRKVVAPRVGRYEVCSGARRRFCSPVAGASTKRVSGKMAMGMVRTSK